MDSLGRVCELRTRRLWRSARDSAVFQSGHATLGHDRLAGQLVGCKSAASTLAARGARWRMGESHATHHGSSGTMWISTEEQR